jgi:O-antigen/teichoic acid export membrane protein
VTTAPQSDRSLAATIGRNTFFGIFASLTQVGTRFVTVPIVISHLGLDGYGIWAIIMTAAAYMRFGSMGIKSAFQKYVAEATGSGNFEQANKLVSTGSAAMLILSILGLIPIAFFSRTLARIAGVPDNFLDSTSGAISLLALIMVLSNVGAAYEAIVMGGHRIDLTRKFGTVFTVLEAIAIVAFLHFGYGLIAMSAIMAFSEIGYLLCCYFTSRQVLPAIRISTRYLTPSVLPELLTFAGSYQLLNILEVIYGAILPILVLKFFGAHATGVCAVTGRLVGAAMILQDAFLLPILSGGSMVFASGSAEETRVLLTKSFKTSLTLAMLPLAFVASHGSFMILAWTGQSDPSFRMVLWLMCLAGLFKSVSLLQLVLYRASGRALMDNLRQVLRILILLSIGLMGRRLGFQGILAGLAAAELIGMIFMFFAMTHAFPGFRVKLLFPETLKLIAATLAMLAVGSVVAHVPVPWTAGERWLAMIRLGGISLASLAVVWPSLLLTGTISKTEGAAILGVFRKKAGANI